MLKMESGMRVTRKTFLGGLVSSVCLTAFGDRAEKPLAKFLLMSDTHVESDFRERGRDCYALWRPGNHAALVKTYEFINNDPFCRDAQFALFCGDQLNTGYTRTPRDLAAERAIYFETLKSLNLHSRAADADLKSFDFSSPGWYLCRENLPRGMKPFREDYPALNSRVIALQGNHDTGVREFYRECAFTCGGVRFICFFASYVGLPAAPGTFNSTGMISNESLAFVEKEMKAAAENASIRHIVLASHWAIAPKSPDFACPILGACKENGFNDNRGKLLSLADKYSCRLYINGHEHNKNYAVAEIGNLRDVNCASVTGDGASWAIVEMFAESAVFTVYSRARAVEEKNGAYKITALPEKLFTKVIPLVP